MKHLFYTALILSVPALLQAQVEAPLQSNRLLQRYYAEQGVSQAPPAWRGPARACMLEQAGKNYIDAGETVYIDTQIDTSELGENGVYSCLNCDDNPIGETAIIDDSLSITAADDLIGVEYSFTVEYCASEGCREAILTVVGRRRGQHYFPPTIELPSEGRVQTEGEPSLLPGPLACNKFIDAEDLYEGRAQRFYFTTYSGPDSSFFYDASRYAGVDSVYLVLCDTFAICDTFHFAFNIIRDTIQFQPGGREVFLDDFSGEGPLTDPLLWLDTETYINREFAVAPPTVGVATFDGLNPQGTPYGGSLGPADRLTSTYLSLADIEESLFVSFWVQPGGLGERPRPQDELVLEYKDFNGDWDPFAVITVDSFPAVPGQQAASFQFFAYPIPSLYKHEAFQFRLTNYNNRNGINNIWQVDYIRVSERAAEPSIDDLAFTAAPRPILSRYSSMPWRHFQEAEAMELDSFIEVSARSLDLDDGQNAEPSFVRLEELSTGVELFDASLFGGGAERNFPEGTYKERTYGLSGGGVFGTNIYSNFLSLMSGATFDGPERLEFRMEYGLTTSQATGPGYESVLRNDQVAATTAFDNYFAYDDGTAESALVAQEDDQIAVKFTALADDTLRAIRMHFPHMISDVSNQEFNLKVWVEVLDSEPEFVMNFLRPLYPDQILDTLQGFTTYLLTDANGNPKPLPLPAGDFYIGWEQLTNCTFTDCIPFGLDKNNPQAKAISYFKSGSSDLWRAFPDLGIPVPAGALMVRPVVGSETPVPTAAEEASSEPFSLRVFPNPARDILHLLPAGGRYEEYRIELYNSVGQRLLQGPMPAQLEVGQYQSGVYLLRAMKKAGGWVQRKVVLVD